MSNEHSNPGCQTADTSPEMSIGDLFFQAEPAVAGLPHLITILDGELIGKISHLTKTRPGLWPLPAPFDENDQYNEVRETARFADWGLPLNQAEVQGVGRLVKEALFGANLMLLSSAVDESRLGPIGQTTGQRLENGAWFTPGFQDLPELPKVIELAGWVLIPVGPSRSRALVAVAPDQTVVIDKLQEWCDRFGRDVWKLVRVEGRTALKHFAAPKVARENAIRQRIDLFLGEVELWFGDTDELPNRVGERIEHLRALRENISKARRPPS
jgi:hypothetical protein